MSTDWLRTRDETRQAALGVFNSAGQTCLQDCIADKRGSIHAERCMWEGGSIQSTTWIAEPSGNGCAGGREEKEEKDERGKRKEIFEKE